MRERWSSTRFAQAVADDGDKGRAAARDRTDEELHEFVAVGLTDDERRAIELINGFLVVPVGCDDERDRMLREIWRRAEAEGR